ncbi:hypothetical protein [Levilactobacillus acidifarinae]|uniref:Uncharacterized protein n=1 Tax=Levilactobacillus acidifarinae DSM 19394 = JCM 15949 TaxID=1423715 RepID=A0A0R1LFY6_9LACO|nr:hypothetical protein [Levilactobacillus acidifarinae]KRK94758.1 hypothetical protein FD25_GL000733 [Levilactobacillus acidifarinae DSM 19394]GEO68516.1 hypothetical protein LAC03_04260 [Levilactobacillus acidifarinae]
MRLIDFDRSTSDLAPQLRLYVEGTPNQALQDLRVQGDRLDLITGAGRPLTLDQFRARTQQVSPTASLFLAGPPPQRLYGYRLIPQCLLLG